MKKILILYFSGVGATKKIAELMYVCISQKCEADIFSIENNTHFNMNDYDALIFGTPVYHAAPSDMVIDFINRIRPLRITTPAFIYNTRALWSCNTNRILAKQLKIKNIVTILDKDYRSPASDGSLIAPFIKRFFEFDKHIREKIINDITAFLKLLQNEAPQGYIPRFKFSSVLNAPNKLAGKLITFKIYLHPDKCSKCGKCIVNCPFKAMKKGKCGHPVQLLKNCKNCYRCIHQCPQKALSLSRRKAHLKRITFKCRHNTIEQFPKNGYSGLI